MSSRAFGPPPAPAAVVAVGCAVAWVVAAAWAVIDFVVPSRPSEQLGFLADGSPVIAVRPGGGGETTYRDASGRAVPRPDPNAGGMSYGVNLPAGPGDRGHDTSRSAVFTYTDGQSPATYWYFAARRQTGGLGHFVGYDSLSKARVGYIGTAGFRRDPPPDDEAFAVAGSGPGLSGWSAASVQSRAEAADYPAASHLPAHAAAESLSPAAVFVTTRDGRLYRIDLKDASVRVVLDRGVLSAAVVPAPFVPDRPAASYLAVRTAGGMSVFDDVRSFHAHFPIPGPFFDRSFLFLLTTTGAVFTAAGPYDSLGTEQEHAVAQVEMRGRAQFQTVTLRSGGGRSTGNVVIAAFFPTPLPLVTFALAIRCEELLRNGLEPTPAAAAARSMRDYWPAFAAVTALAAVLAALCHRRQVRYGAGRAGRVAWPLAVLLFGVPAYLAYLFTRPWPPLAACPACGSAVPRDRAACARCGAEFPRPALTGTEVFA